MKKGKKIIWRFGLLLIVAFLALTGCSSSKETSKEETKTNEKTTKKEPVELLNVSYDPTRELYQEFNEEFAKHWNKKTGQQVTMPMLLNNSIGCCFSLMIEAM